MSDKEQRRMRDRSHVLDTSRRRACRESLIAGRQHRDKDRGAAFGPITMETHRGRFRDESSRKEDYIPPPPRMLDMQMTSEEERSRFQPQSAFHMV